MRRTWRVLRPSSRAASAWVRSPLSTVCRTLRTSRSRWLMGIRSGGGTSIGVAPPGPVPRGGGGGVGGVPAGERVREKAAVQLQPGPVRLKAVDGGAGVALPDLLLRLVPEAQFVVAPAPDGLRLGQEGHRLGQVLPGV